jgi:DNA (cytosine-5)-methyltransferase 1
VRTILFEEAKPRMNTDGHRSKTLGSLFAGIGGFDLGFEWAGWQTVWQVEIDRENRTTLADRFPRAAQFSDVRNCGSRNLGPVDCITLGFPCQDISVMGATAERKGLSGERSGLFSQGLRIVEELRPEWLVIENVPRLLTINAGQDFSFIIRSLAERGYVGLWRVLDAQYFGVAARRRRLFVVAGLGRQPSLEFLADASPVGGLSSSFGASQDTERAQWVGYCLTAPNKHNHCHSRYNHGSENFVAESDGWDSMLERARTVEAGGLRLGLAQADLAEAYGAGNAVCPQVAKWIAEILNRS